LGLLAELFLEPFFEALPDFFFVDFFLFLLPQLLLGLGFKKENHLTLITNIPLGS
jgi:hypothetical protein